MATVILFGTFVVLLVLGVPVAFVLGISALAHRPSTWACRRW